MSSTAHSRFRSAALRGAFVLAFVSVAWLAPWVGAALAEEPGIVPLLSNASNALWLTNDILILTGERNGEYGTYQITFGKNITYKKIYSSPYVWPIRVIGKEWVLFKDKADVLLKNNPMYYGLDFHLYNARTGLTHRAFHADESDTLFYNDTNNTLYFFKPFKILGKLPMKCVLLDDLAEHMHPMATDGGVMYIMQMKTIEVLKNGKIESTFPVGGSEYRYLAWTESAKGKIYIETAPNSTHTIYLYVYKYDQLPRKLLEYKKSVYSYAKDADILFFADRDSGTNDIFSLADDGTKTFLFSMESKYWLGLASPSGDRFLVESEHHDGIGVKTRVDASIAFIGRK